VVIKTKIFQIASYTVHGLFAIAHEIAALS